MGTRTTGKMDFSEGSLTTLGISKIIPQSPRRFFKSKVKTTQTHDNPDIMRKKQGVHSIQLPGTHTLSLSGQAGLSVKERESHGPCTLRPLFRGEMFESNFSVANS